MPINQAFEPYSTLYTENQILKCDERGKTFYLKTQNTCFARVKIDCGVEQNTQNSKCDYLVIKQGIEDIEIFIELKGKQIQDGAEQLIATYNQYATKTDSIKHYPVIVSSPIKNKKKRTPKTKTTTHKIKAELAQVFKNVLITNENIVKTRYNPDKNTIEKIN